MYSSRKWNSVAAAFIVAILTTTAQAAKKNIIDTAVDAGSFTTLAAALEAAGLVDALQGAGPFTVFAPTDEAFEQLPEGTVETLLKPENKQRLTDILTYHVVPGSVPAAKVVKSTGAKTLNGQQVDIKVSNGKVQVDQATVVTTDIACSNGIIHVIDKVILPAEDNIPATAIKAGNFTTLVAALKAADLVDALSGKGPFTVLAPTDEAFAKLPEATLQSLLKPENKDQLAAILKYHVLVGRIYSSDAFAAGKAKTLQGASVVISVDSKGAKVNGANLLATDIDASNGVIHVIDTVILPPDGKQARAMHPRQMIELAISEGAPLYNAGHPGACAKVYMTAVHNLLAMENHGMCASTVHSVRTALNKAHRTSCSDSQAWTLRHALDLAYNSMRPIR